MAPTCAWTYWVVRMQTQRRATCAAAQCINLTFASSKLASPKPRPSVQAEGVAPRVAWPCPLLWPTRLRRITGCFVTQLCAKGPSAPKSSDLPRGLIAPEPCSARARARHSRRLPEEPKLSKSLFLARPDACHVCVGTPHRLVPPALGGVPKRGRIAGRKHALAAIRQLGLARMW